MTSPATSGLAPLAGDPASGRAPPPDPLGERLRFETLLSRLSTTFVHLPAEEVDGRIERGLGEIVGFLGIERASLAQFSEDGGEFIVTHSFTLPGLPPMPRVNLAAIWPWYTGQVRRGVVMRFSFLPDDLPAEAVAEREYHRRGGLPRSHLLIPFQVGNEVLGAIGFGSFRREIRWTDEMVGSLSLFGQVFANALARRLASEKETRLRDQLALAARVNLLGELAASLAHEVSQPLCAIVGNAQAALRLLDAGDPAEARAALRDIAADGLRAGAVINRIRDLVHLAPAAREALDANSLVREVSALTRSEMARRRVSVRLDLAHGLPPIVGDRVGLQQVILNLLTNGADAMALTPEPARQLVVRTAAGDAAVTLSIVDAGAGVNPRDLDRIFDAFFTTKPGGMGIGLSICQSIVKSHGGRIWADSAPGAGTTFHVILPAPRGVPP
jgi:signal transduction histidine kinase